MVGTPGPNGKRTCSGPSTNEPEISIVLPCLNEERSVATCVEEARSACAALGLPAEVIVANNNSTDRSADEAHAAGARVIEVKTPGYGAALRTGIDLSQGQVVVIADADGSYPLERIPELVRPVLKGEADLVLGNRFPGASLRSMPLLHRLVGTPAITMLLRQGTGGLSVRDSQSGFRAISRNSLQQLQLKSTGMEFASEMLIRAHQRRLVVKEVPVGYRARVGESKLNTWRDGARHLSLINRLSPHAFLWYFGLLMVTVGLLAQLLIVMTGSAISIGSVGWQPVFFGPAAQVVGVASILVAGVLAQHGPGACEATKRAFGWIRDRNFIRAARHISITFILGAIGIDASLWFARSSPATYEKVALAGLAQAGFLTGCVLLLFSVLYNAFGEQESLETCENSPSRES